jgi:hypothetical protein
MNVFTASIMAALELLVSVIFVGEMVIHYLSERKNVINIKRSTHPGKTP